MYRSGNPALRDSTFDKSSYKDANWWEVSESNLMTIEGVAEKTGFLLLITATTALAVVTVAVLFTAKIEPLHFSV